MRLLHFVEPPPEAWGEALEQFERQFKYPLGKDGYFRISHGPAYLPFFQAMGPASLWVAEDHGRVVGTLVSVPRLLQIQGGPEAGIPAHYLCDLKVDPGCRHGRVLPRLMAAARQGIEASGGKFGYGIVMQGTARSPDRYTGRLGIPRFGALADLAILRIAGTGHGETGDAVAGSPAALLNPGPVCRVTGGISALRSLMPAVPVTSPDGNAGGMLEDTRKGKRLWSDGGEEMLSAHLSGFYFGDPQAGAGVIRRALDLAQTAGCGAIFAAVPASRGPALRQALLDLTVTAAPATVFGCGLPPGCDWWVDTAEI